MTVQGVQLGQPLERIKEPKVHPLPEVNRVVLEGHPAGSPSPTSKFKVVSVHEIAGHELKRQPDHFTAVQAAQWHPCVFPGRIGGNVGIRPSHGISRGKALKHFPLQSKRVSQKRRQERFE
jgi:hypothetical protein